MADINTDDIKTNKIMVKKMRNRSDNFLNKVAGLNSKVANIKPS